MAIIKTPDQRVRVFISSTINELAEERKAAREAIENLRLIPVFFEAGARPHPPRDLYSAYLDQSHIFLGIYWNNYGWVAPGAEISGLEDEYRLCGNRKPKLIYVKRSDERQPRLNELLADIEKSDTACYQFFSDALELKRLIENDLSVLMSEIFENALSEPASERLLEVATNKTDLTDLPIIRSEMLGRDEDLARVCDLLTKPGVGLVTLLGAGGTGKTTLSVHVGHCLKDKFRHGAVFVPLAPITDHRLVGNTIAESLGLQDSGKNSISETLCDFLSDKDLLLILDNFEQVTESSRLVSDLMARCRDLRILVTSRTSLHVRNERICNLATLSLPEEDFVTDLNAWPATQLFVERALQVNPRIDLNRENTEAIIEICRRLDGLPLAIELAAARTRFFQPAALMSRIEKTLDLVSKGHKDLPERQQTLRGAIEWSYNLLSPETQKSFRQLGVFRRSWTMDGALAVLCGPDDDIDIEEFTERLLDVSLIKPMLLTHSAEPRFNMLQTVHEYAKEMLDISPEAQETKERFAHYFLNELKETEGKVWGHNGDAWLDRIENEYQNIRAAFYKFIGWQQWEKAWEFIPMLAQYWTIRGGFSESTQMIADARLNNPAMLDMDGVDSKIKADAMTWGGYSSLFLFQFELGFSMLARAEEIAESIGVERTLGYALAFDGCYGAYLNWPGSAEKVMRCKELIDKHQDRLLHSMWLLWSAEYFRLKGHIGQLKANFDMAWKIASEDGNIYIMGAVQLLRFNQALVETEIDWRKVIDMGKEMNTLFPDKGYKGLKAAAFHVLAHGYMRVGDMDLAKAALLKGLELSRTSGEKESEVYACMEAASYLASVGQWKDAYTVQGAMDNFIEVNHFPLVGGAKMEYDVAKGKLEARWNHPDSQRAYGEGSMMSLSEGVKYALAAIEHID